MAPFAASAGTTKRGSVALRLTIDDGFVGRRKRHRRNERRSWPGRRGDGRGGVDVDAVSTLVQACGVRDTGRALAWVVTRSVHAHLALNISRVVASTDATTWSSMSPSETISDGFESPRRFVSAQRRTRQKCTNASANSVSPVARERAVKMSVSTLVELKATSKVSHDPNAAPAVARTLFAFAGELRRMMHTKNAQLHRTHRHRARHRRRRKIVARTS